MYQDPKSKKINLALTSDGNRFEKGRKTVRNSQKKKRKKKAYFGNEIYTVYKQLAAAAAA